MPARRPWSDRGPAGRCLRAGPGPGPGVRYRAGSAAVTWPDSRKAVPRTRTGLRFPLADGLDASAQVNIDWDNEPAPGRESTDVATILGLGYGW